MISWWFQIFVDVHLIWGRLTQFDIIIDIFQMGWGLKPTNQGTPIA